LPAVNKIVFERVVNEQHAAQWVALSIGSGGLVSLNFRRVLGAADR